MIYGDASGGSTVFVYGVSVVTGVSFLLNFAPLLYEIHIGGDSRGVEDLSLR